MKNKELSAAFDLIADLLEIQGEQAFRVNSYRRAARTFKDLNTDVAKLAEQGKLGDLPGIGKSTVEKVNEFLSAGTIALLDELKAAVPSGLPDLLNIPGMGPKKIALAWKQLNVESVADLKRVIDSGELATLKGMGEKSVKQIADAIAFTESSGGRTPLGLAWPLAESLADAMRAFKGVHRVEIAGSLRRGCETIGDLDLLCEAKDGAAVIKAFTTLEPVKRVLAAGDTKGSVIVERRDGADIQVDLRVVRTESFGAALQYFTGSKEHNVRLREIASKKKWKLNEWGLFDGDKPLGGKDEASIYKKLKVPHVPPEQREDRGEFDLETVEDLVTLDHIRGDLHMHTTASDGTETAAKMADAACARGYEYIAITDHSKSSVIAKGLSIDKMWRQIEKIRKLNDTIDTVSVLIGCECDILSDGSLDYPDTLLAACDLVVASVHVAMKQPRDTITKRLIDAMENPYATILGHPTARLLQKREAMDIDMEAVIEAAARTHTALEVNASWQRLDLCDRHVRMAVDAGVKLAINTDAHSIQQLDQMRYGIATARRGWAKPADVINTMHLPLLRKWIRKKRK